MRKLITLFLLVVAVAVHAQSAAQARKVLDKVAAVALADARHSLASAQARADPSRAPSPSRGVNSTPPPPMARCGTTDAPSGAI